MITTLLVEDHAAFRVVLRNFLLSRFPDMRVEEAGDAQEAWTKLLWERPDLVFMDIQLPDENGLNLTQRIKALDPKIVVVVLTTLDLPEYRSVAKKLGANHFFAKGSVSCNELLGLVREIAIKRELSSENEQE